MPSVLFLDFPYLLSTTGKVYVFFCDLRDFHYCMKIRGSKKSTNIHFFCIVRVAVGEASAELSLIPEQLSKRLLLPCDP